MANLPVVVISSPSPLLESIAFEVLGGATGETPATTSPVVVTDSRGAPASAVSASFVFLGYRADSEESRRIAVKTLTELAARSPPPLHVALFEASVRGSSGDSVTSGPELPSGVDPTIPMPTTLERFVIERSPGGEFMGDLELARARSWAARTHAAWHSHLSPPSTEEARRGATPIAVRSVPWCGATE